MPAILTVFAAALAAMPVRAADIPAEAENAETAKSGERGFY
ncbi:hypothetical protein [Erythrobacter sp. YT30]|nr:hypothetical protein [Erythrobacter sp. YT30]